MTTANLRRKYNRALKKLDALAHDFSAGSNQRFDDQLRKVKAIHDDLYYTQQKEQRS